MQPFILSNIKKQIVKPVLSCGQQQQWEAVPPYQLLESAQTATSQDPRACSGLPGLELGAANQIPVFNSVLTQNYQSVLSAQMAVIRIKLLQQSLTTLPYCFPSFLNEIPESHSPE